MKFYWLILGVLYVWRVTHLLNTQRLQWPLQPGRGRLLPTEESELSIMERELAGSTMDARQLSMWPELACQRHG